MAVVTAGAQPLGIKEPQVDRLTRTYVIRLAAAAAAAALRNAASERELSNAGGREDRSAGCTGGWSVLHCSASSFDPLRHQFIWLT
jgi:hypothetical protein